MSPVCFGIGLARLMGYRSRFGVLTGGAVGIGGASASMAIAAVIPVHADDKLKERATIFTVIGVSTLSTLAMVLYPMITSLLGLGSQEAGVFLGGTIHDVAQVVGAGYGMSKETGDMGFGLFPMLDRFKEFKHDWERSYLEGSKDLVFRNTYGDIETSLRELSASGTRFEFECYDTSHLYNLAHFIDRGLIKPPFFVQTVFGILGGIGAHPDDVMHMKRTADRLFGDAYRWSALGAGRNQMRVAAMAASMGGNVRVGLEDSLWIAPGKLAESNAQQVRKVREMLEGLGLQIATPAQAREILSLKGAGNVAF